MNLYEKVKAKSPLVAPMGFKVSKEMKEEIDTFCEDYKVDFSKMARMAVYDMMDKIKKERNSK